uniref:Adipokinetic hormone n=2 Tax=Spodoptera TaxID=7106 RepID=A0ZWH4_SPOFR|nr:adipokinetic hormone precursor [Spodoptera frugiperda]
MLLLIFSLYSINTTKSFSIGSYLTNTSSVSSAELTFTSSWGGRRPVCVRACLCLRRALVSAVLASRTFPIHFNVNFFQV